MTSFPSVRRGPALDALLDGDQRGDFSLLIFHTLGLKIGVSAK